MEPVKRKAVRTAAAACLLIGVLLVLPLALVLTVPLVNDHTAAQLERELRRLPLPEDTVLLDSLSAAGKLTGSGNGMQYLGAILIKSELTLEELEAHYAPNREGPWDFLVREQTDSRVDVVDHGSYAFANWEDGGGTYIIYTWGNSDYFLRDLDIRGH